ncbi:TetR/AcrR family transcriptional regulator [Sphingobacterium thalpophilum]|uniref:DNA-binding transcriptional repressor AcrR n=2 Tax=Sphingobacterium thalpophilum TaxID=259 RepID=A0A4U9W4F5_9SPHI|nr:TetR/AcrR family transcriptional regulator [Sphingobacterium thalpophilum]VTR53589.1 DNA-binding transcriptional repressor AcrR [Sphingobacterium thalpophilum]
MNFRHFLYVCRVMTVQQENIREEIILSSMKVFETYGYTRVSMQDISKACGKGRSTLYYYFDSKMAVFDAIAMYLCREVFTVAKASYNRNASLEHNLTGFLRAKLRQINLITKRFHLAFEDLKSDPALLLSKTRYMLDEEIALIREMIEVAISKKEIQSLEKKDVLFLSEMLVTTSRCFEQEVILFDRFPDFETRLAWLTSICVKGLC